MEILRKIGRKIAKANELGFLEMEAILSLLSLYGGNQKMKLPLLHKLWYAPRRALSETFIVAPSDGCPATVLRRTPCDPNACPPLQNTSVPCDPKPVRPVSSIGHTGFGLIATPSLWPWLCGSAKQPSGFLVNHYKPRELGVASANHHSRHGSHKVQTRPWFWGSTKKPSTTSSCCS
jgi:hypothetical protein